MLDLHDLLIDLANFPVVLMYIRFRIFNKKWSLFSSCNESFPCNVVIENPKFISLRRYKIFDRP